MPKLPRAAALLALAAVSLSLAGPRPAGAQPAPPAPAAPPAAAGAAPAAPPLPEDPGANPLGRAGEVAPRFSLQPVEGGLMRLDARTGAMSFCSVRSGAWSCALVPEERSAYEAEIRRLNERIATLEKAAVPQVLAPPAAVPDASPGAPGPGGEAAAPDKTPDAGRATPGGTPPAGEQTTPDEARAAFDRAMRMAEDAFRRFYDMVQRLRQNPPGDTGEEKL
ncbi:hypothetical protein [Ancylobacter lacus]|uniref:hypothetical protein n=1 Tax=Ancylobacter lacus TaxID=2579970 RepID=UPI001BCFE21F|nr:hypothetical protein [Ancylobacter lacus]MBS7539065.1 hypothetical protein [Ancylobacter lacus]